jgi:CMP-N-acetylneuraminic acid synthetase
MRVLTVVLARAGSRGLKDKHLLPLLDRPVIAYTFDHARPLKERGPVVVSSDCPQIRKLAESAGFYSIDRPARLATDDASVQDVMLHAMDAVEEATPFRADALVVLYGNVPVRDPGVIEKALDRLADTGCDSVRSFCPVGKWHPGWMARLVGDRVEALQPGPSIHRRQDLEPLYLHDGAVVAVARKSMLRGKRTPSDPHAFFGVDRRAIETAAGETVEIDQLRDLYWAEAVLRETQELVPPAPAPAGKIDAAAEASRRRMRMAS